jgi:acetyl-CoA carboxylase biotin carboxyl carrier protein
MKVFTEIPAGISGKVAEILVQDKQPVEFGQPLFRLEPA